jgi:uncharacterized protein
MNVLRLPQTAALALALADCTSPRPPAEPAAPASAGLVLPEGGRHMKHVQVAMRDGARLNTGIWLPGEGRHPVVLIRTPYQTEVDGEDPFLNRLIAEGYGIVQQHERGRFLSEGEMRMLGRADEDGWDTLDWIAAQPWSNGEVATYGCSSSAENQLKLASLNHPAHKAMIAYSMGVGVAEAGPFREQGNFWRGGVWQQGWANYFFEEMPVDWPQLPPELSDGERRALLSRFSLIAGGLDPQTAAYDRARMHLPMIDMAKAAGAPDTELEEYLQRGPAGAVWAEDRVTDADAAKVRVPGLYAEGLYDISARASTAWFEAVRKANPPGTQSITLLNGRHCAFSRQRETQTIGDRELGDTRYPIVDEQIAFLNRWLKDDAAAAPAAGPVRAYMAGANRWATFDAVPVAGAAARTQGAVREYFLSSGGRANTLDGDGRLLDGPPSSAGEDRFRYDPANPVIARGGEIAGLGTDQETNDGAYDQRAIERRPDVLVYTSDPLGEDLAVFGYVETELFVGSDAPDTDFTVKLVDVAPDGTAWNIADSIQRMRYREGEDRQVFMQPGETYRISPPPMLVANVFKAGHRIRLEVSSSNFPSYARNLNTAGDPYTTTEMRVAENRIVHSGDQASRLSLPVVAWPQE